MFDVLLVSTREVPVGAVWRVSHCFLSNYPRLVVHCVGRVAVQSGGRNFGPAVRGYPRCEEAGGVFQRSPPRAYGMMVVGMVGMSKPDFDRRCAKSSRRVLSARVARPPM